MLPKIPQDEKVIAIISEAAETEILPRFQRLDEDQVRAKTSGELVTVADVAAEKHLTQRLRDLLPGSLVVGEEAVAERPQVIEHFAEEDPVWVIDPIDGTGNFARGHPVFAVMVGLVAAGRVLAGWIHDPIGGETVTARLGEGAWLGARRLRMADAEGPVSALRGTLHAGQFATPEMASHVRTRRDRVEAINSLNCAGHEYIRMAKGEMHFSLFTKVMPWDHVPGTLILAECGGQCRFLDGEPYEPRRRDAGGLMLAPSLKAWHDLKEALFGID